MTKDLPSVIDAAWISVQRIQGRQKAQARSLHDENFISVPAHCCLPSRSQHRGSIDKRVFQEEIAR